MSNFSNKQKIFCIGQGRTGTVSLTEALQILGYNVIHWPEDDEVLSMMIEQKERQLKLLEEYDGISDACCSVLYKLLDKIYLNSKFILTIRKTQDWYKSTERKLTRERSFRPLQKMEEVVLTKLYTTVNPEKNWQTKFEEFNEDAKLYFKNRTNDFLILNICDGIDNNWNHLCKFLDKQIPNTLFPTMNMGKRKRLAWYGV